MINSNNKLDVTLDFENVDMNDVNVYVAFKNNGKLVGMKMPQASELKGIDLIDKEYTDIFHLLLTDYTTNVLCNLLRSKTVCFDDFFRVISVKKFFL